MALPPFVEYATEDEYRQHYEHVYCKGEIHTFDGIGVFFSKRKFYHAFFESSQRDGIKDTFSPSRAQRIDWIRATLEQSDASLYQGWINKSKSYDASRRVTAAFENFVVIVVLRLGANGALKSNFMTCFDADNSIAKIRTSPLWTREACILALEKGGR